MKWAIKLRSKHTGEETYLGAEYSAPAEAIKYAQENVCQRCNYFDVIPLDDSMVWTGRREGWRSR